MFKIEEHPTDVFPWARIVPENISTQPTVAMILLPGIGETTDHKSLQQAVRWPGFYVNKTAPSLYLGAAQSNIPIYLVQTASTYAYNHGEINFICGKVREDFGDIALSFVVISLGGYGLMNFFNANRSSVDFYDKITSIYMLVPGAVNDGEIVASVDVIKEMKCGPIVTVYSANDDNVVPVAYAKKLYGRLYNIIGGDRSRSLIYEKGGHNISARIFNAFFPWSYVNDGSYKAVSSWEPSKSIYQEMIEYSGKYDGDKDVPVIRREFRFSVDVRIVGTAVFADGDLEKIEVEDVYVIE